jgi:translation initiation factor 3 subunit F
MVSAREKGTPKLVGDVLLIVDLSDVAVTRYSSSPTLNPYSALIQNFFSQECAAYGGQAVHLTVDADLAGAAEGKDGLGVKAYVS